MVDKKKRDSIRDQFIECRDYFVALGDTTRQEILLVLMDAGNEGMSVNDIASKIHLSRPAISHHLKILKNAQIINIRRTGTSNFYYIFIREAFQKVQNMMRDIESVITDADYTRELEMLEKGEKQAQPS